MKIIEIIKKCFVKWVSKIGGGWGKERRHNGILVREGGREDKKSLRVTKFHGRNWRTIKGESEKQRGQVN